MAKFPTIKDNTPEEAEIKRQVKADPDTWEVVEDSSVLRCARPKDKTKEQVTVRLDKDLIAALRTSNAKGWQIRLNAAVRAGLKRRLVTEVTK